MGSNTKTVSEVLLQMDVIKHCVLLMKLKNDGMKLSTYMGRRWFVSKVMLVILASVLLFLEEKALRITGFIVLGYILGVIVANVRSYLVVKKKWELQKEFIDWDKVEEYLKAIEEKAAVNKR
jgi:lipoprotein signal peptidase